MEEREREKWELEEMVTTAFGGDGWQLRRGAKKVELGGLDGNFLSFLVNLEASVQMFW